MKITDVYDSNGALFYTVELEEDVFVDVKCVNSVYYVMSCEDGYITYNCDGNTFEYSFNETDVIEFVKRKEKENMKTCENCDHRYEENIPQPADGAGCTVQAQTTETIKNKSVSERLKAIMDNEAKAEVFADALYEEFMSDGESFDGKARSIARVFLGENTEAANNLLIAICGWGIESLLNIAEYGVPHLTEEDIAIKEQQHLCDMANVRNAFKNSGYYDDDVELTDDDVENLAYETRRLMEKQSLSFEDAVDVAFNSFFYD